MTNERGGSRAATRTWNYYANLERSKEDQVHDAGRRAELGAP
jgi:hypothetical protein